jgi:hypothetical protein
MPQPDTPITSRRRALERVGATLVAPAVLASNATAATEAGGASSPTARICQGRS